MQCNFITILAIKCKNWIWGQQWNFGEQEFANNRRFNKKLWNYSNPLRIRKATCLKYWSWGVIPSSLVVGVTAVCWPGQAVCAGLPPWLPQQCRLLPSRGHWLLNWPVSSRSFHWHLIVFDSVLVLGKPKEYYVSFAKVKLQSVPSPETVQCTLNTSEHEQRGDCSRLFPIPELWLQILLHLHTSLEFLTNSICSLLTNITDISALNKGCWLPCFDLQVLEFLQNVGNMRVQSILNFSDMEVFKPFYGE